MHDPLAVEEVAERFLEVEAAVPAGKIDPMDRARFARLVRLCAAKWMLHPRVTLRTSRGKYGMALQFEGPLGGKSFSIFSLRAHHDTAEYRFVGPNPDRKRLGLNAEALEGLERLRDLYEAMLAGNSGAGESVDVVLKGKRMPDLVPLVEETRRTLDGGTETVAAPPQRDSKSQTKRPPLNAQRNVSGAQSPSVSVAASSEPSNAASPAKQPAIPSPGAAVVVLRLACPNPKENIAFYQRVLKREPAASSEGGESATFELGSVLLTIDAAFTKEERRVYGYSGVSKQLGEGLILYLAVDDFALCRRRSRRMKTAIIAEDTKLRRFTIRDPAGYITTITEA